AAVEDAGGGVVVEVDGDEGQGIDGEDVLEFALGGVCHGGVDGLGGDGAFGGEGEVHRETLMTGTRTARPSSLPLRSGITSPMALAAPVLVGIMDWVAARARCRSLW